jgi:hypothetical protein
MWRVLGLLAGRRSSTSTARYGPPERPETRQATCEVPDNRQVVYEQARVRARKNNDAGRTGRSIQDANVGQSPEVRFLPLIRCVGEASVSSRAHCPGGTSKDRDPWWRAGLRAICCEWLPRVSTTDASCLGFSKVPQSDCETQLCRKYASPPRYVVRHSWISAIATR